MNALLTAELGSGLGSAVTGWGAGCHACQMSVSHEWSHRRARTGDLHLLLVMGQLLAGRHFFLYFRLQSGLPTRSTYLLIPRSHIWKVHYHIEKVH